jgi:hypothetical protein
MLEPFLPSTAGKIQALFADGIVHPVEGTLFPKLELSAPQE